MIDNIKLVKDLEVPEEVIKERDGFLYSGNPFFPVINKETGEIKYFESRLRNLRVCLFPYSQKLSIENSIHKFFIGNNYTDFHLTQLEDAVEELSDMLQLDIREASIKRIEYGCNLKVESVGNAISNLVSFQTKEYIPIVDKGGNKYGSKCKFHEHALKAYDKAAQVKQVDGIHIPQGLLRTEIQINRMKYLHQRKEPVPIYHVSDLLDIERLQYLAHDHVEKYGKSVKREIADLSGLSLKEKTAYARIMNPMVRDELKAKHRLTFRSDMRIVKSIQQQSDKLHEDKVTGLLIEKWKDLMHG